MLNYNQNYENFIKSAKKHYLLHHHMALDINRQEILENLPMAECLETIQRIDKRLQNIEITLQLGENCRAVAKEFSREEVQR